MAQKFNHSPLLDKLWASQDSRGYIASDDITRIAGELDISEIELEGVASFYHFFHKKPAGKFTIYLNNSILSELAGYAEIKKAFERATRAPWGGIDPTGTFGLFDTACIGLSDQEPAALINFYPFTQLTPQKVAQIIKALRSGANPRDLADRLDTREYPLLPTDKLIYLRPHQPGKALEFLSKNRPKAVIEAIKRSRLTGMGGAFFPTGKKWELCRNNPGKRHFLVCNADEGEPGTFKDRLLLHRYPELLIEGMIIAGYAIGADEGIIYLRAEYRYLLPTLEKAIALYRRMGWLGTRAPTKNRFQFEIHIQIGAGAYVCGEETALLNSLMGKRGEPGPKVYFPVEKGYWDQPTSVNNVETLCAAARILELGVPTYLSLGTPKSPGTKLLSIAGDCSFPGVYEVEWGISLDELLERCGATDPYLVQLSGPAGQAVPASDRHRSICAEDLICGGSVMIFNSQRDLLHILRNYAQFFVDESCGICTPCRAGNYLLLRKLEKLQKGLASPEDLEEIKDWGRIMQAASRCGLGKTAPNALIQCMQGFPGYFQNQLRKNSTGARINLAEALDPYHQAVRNGN